MRLSARAIGLLISGAILAVLAASMQSLTLARIAGLVVAVPLVSLLWSLVTRATSKPAAVVRTVIPQRPTAGSSATVRLHTTDVRLGPWTTLRERVPSALHRSGTSGGGYTITPPSRGVFSLGPATVHRSDPLNLVRWRVTSGPTDEVIVWPRYADLTREIRAVTLDAAVSRPQGSPQRNLEDLTLREYQRGDDLHRVHWRSSARQGALMVRQDEPSTTHGVDVLLDLGAPEDHSPENGTEWAVSAAASLAVSLIRHRYRVRIATHHTTRGGASDEPLVGPSQTEALDLLARAEAIPADIRDDVHAELMRRARGSGAPILMVVLREPEEALIDRIAPLAGRRRCFALVVSAVARTDLGPLESEGWSVSQVGPDTSVADAWSDLLAFGAR
ncbi:DUF58 domain-containing protein [Occultella aeris]|uniref:DUF58 domain-containing protein n=1 Tax=Occultella aeris TaxID=2761496 RepID=A0A7M4DNZ4_9MICO|nr:DUF58 domain-containing protein [Occultella aeris]VZO39180.1 hypothetical protein HALOF300_03875 [Occultella aeris]